MKSKHLTKTMLTAGAVAAAAGKALAQTDAAVDQSLAMLKTYDWGNDRNTLNAIDKAILDSHGDAAARRALEKKLVDLLVGGISRSAQDYVCRKLRVIGTVQSVDALAALLQAEETSHIARYALECIPDDKAVDAIRTALPKVSNKLKPGIIGSLGKRRDTKSIPSIAKLLGDSDVDVAQAAAEALAMIGTPTVAAPLIAFAKQARSDRKVAFADACLVCADRLLAEGRKTDAVAIYKALSGDDQPKHVKVAAMKGMLTAAAKK